MTIVYRHSHFKNDIRYDTALAIGNFDGFHRGHRELIGRLVSSAKERGLRSVLLSFYPHPEDVLLGRKGRQRLSTLAETVYELRAYGVDALYLMRFTEELSKVSATKFLNEHLIGHLRAKHMVLGPDTAFGHKREGDLTFIKDRLTESKQCTYEVCKELIDREQKISSSRVRSLLVSGEIEQANELLGESYKVTSSIIHGDKRGRTIGFPTLNMRPWKKLLPPHGVYLTLTTLDGREFKSISNIGTRPTVDGVSGVVFETHLLDTKLEPVYGKKATVRILTKIRDEQAFDSIETLTSQIERDVEQARSLHALYRV